MTNSKCEKCGLYLDDIIKTKCDKINLAKLINKRLRKIFGIGYQIYPYIKHNEIIHGHICDGFMNYEPFTPNPVNFTEFNFNDIFFNYNIDDVIKKINEN